MPIEGLVTAELGPVELFGETLAAVVLSVAGYLGAKLGLGWWRPRRPRL